MRERIARERCIFVTNANQQDVCQRSIADEAGAFPCREALLWIKSWAASRDILPAADSLACSLLKKSAAVSGIFGSEG
jgi:hypothetical protein